MIEQEIITLELGNKIITLQLNPLNSEIDADELTNIRYDNIIGELLVSPTVLNRFGILQADMEAIVKKSKLNLEILEAKLKEKKKIALTSVKTDDKGKEKIDKPTIPEIDAAVKMDPEYLEYSNKLIEDEKHFEYIKALYWSLKDKCDKLNTLAKGIKPEEFEKEILTSSINNIIIKSHNKLIK